MAKAAKAFDRVELFAALADATRLRLLNLMQGREVCVCYFVEVLGQSQPKISRHLAYLRRAGVVSARRQGKWMHYKMEWPKDASARAVLEATVAGFADDAAMLADRQLLGEACCAPQGFVSLVGAPVPTTVAV